MSDYQARAAAARAEAKRCLGVARLYLDSADELLDVDDDDETGSARHELGRMMRALDALQMALACANIGWPHQFRDAAYWQAETRVAEHNLLIEGHQMHPDIHWPTSRSLAAAPDRLDVGEMPGEAGASAGAAKQEEAPADPR